MFNHAQYPEVPDRTLETLDRWATEAALPGSFARACLQNNLKEAVLRADKDNRAALIKIVQYMYDELPHRCWGSVEAVELWSEYIEQDGPIADQEVS